jgi:hypothetical protein
LSDTKNEWKEKRKEKKRKEKKRNAETKINSNPFNITSFPVLL